MQHPYLLFIVFMINNVEVVVTSYFKVRVGICLKIKVPMKRLKRAKQASAPTQLEMSESDGIWKLNIYTVIAKSGA